MLPLNIVKPDIEIRRKNKIFEMCIFYRLLYQILLINFLLLKLANAFSVDELVHKLVHKESRPTFPFLVGPDNATILYFKTNSIYKVDYRKDRVIGRYHNFKFGLNEKRTYSSSDDYFCGILTEQSEDDYLYTVVHRETVLKITKSYFEDGLFHV